mgnify:CR=1 FL=1
MRFPLLLFLAASVLQTAGCQLFGDRPCEPGRYACPDAAPVSPDLSRAGACTLENPCALPSPQPHRIDSTSAGALANLTAISGRGADAWFVGRSPAGQGVLLHASPGQLVRTEAVLPVADPQAVTATATDPLRLFIASQGSALHEYDPQSRQVTPRSLDTGGCQGRISANGALYGVFALAPEDLWLVGAPTSDSAAGLFRVRGETCQVLPEPASAGLRFSGVWGAARSPVEPAQRIVWAVGDSGAVVVWTFQGPDGQPLAQNFRLGSATAFRAISGSSRCPTAPTLGDETGTCVFMITADALYRATDTMPMPIALPVSINASPVELTGVFVDGEFAWICGAQSGTGFVARQRLRSGEWSYAGLSPLMGTPRAAWGAGDGSLWLAGDQGTIVYLPSSSSNL